MPARPCSRRRPVARATAPPWEKPANTSREAGTPRSPSRAIRASTWAMDSRTPASSARFSMLRSRMSYQARMGTPPLMVTGRTGACGKTKRRAGQPGRTSSGTMGSKSWPSAPRPCSQRMVHSGLAPVWRSTQSSRFITFCPGGRTRDYAGSGASALQPPAARHPGRGKQYLPELIAADPEAGHGHRQVVVPHAPEALAVALGQPRPGLVEVAPPGLQGQVVVGAEVLPVLDDEAAFHRPGDLRGRGQHGVGEDVAADPRIGVAGAQLAADRVQQEQAVGRQQLPHLGEEAAVVAPAD